MWKMQVASRYIHHSLVLTENHRLERERALKLCEIDTIEQIVLSNDFTNHRQNENSWKKL